MKHPEPDIKMVQSLNFPISPRSIAPHGGWAALAEHLRALQTPAGWFRGRAALLVKE